LFGNSNPFTSSFGKQQDNVDSFFGDEDFFPKPAVLSPPPSTTNIPKSQIPEQSLESTPKIPPRPKIPPPQEDNLKKKPEENDMFGDSGVFSSIERTSTITPVDTKKTPASASTPTAKQIPSTVSQSGLSKDIAKNSPDTTTATLAGKKDKSPTPTPTPVVQPQAQVAASPLAKQESFFGDSKFGNDEFSDFAPPPDVKPQATTPSMAHPLAFGTTPEKESSLFSDNFGPSDFSSIEPAIATDKPRKASNVNPVTNVNVVTSEKVNFDSPFGDDDWAKF